MSVPRRIALTEIAARYNRDVLRSFMGVTDRTISAADRRERRQNADWLARELAREGFALKKFITTKGA